jgi:hypothetical protein
VSGLTGCLHVRALDTQRCFHCGFRMPLSAPTCASPAHEIKSWNRQARLQVLQFFDCDALRSSYSGLIFELRRDLQRIEAPR